MQQGRLTEQGAKRLGRPDLAGSIVTYEPHPTRAGFTKGVYSGERSIGGILTIGPEGILESKPFIVLVKHSQERDTHLYSLLASDGQQAEEEALKQFDQDYTPDELGEWAAIALEPTFDNQAAHVARIDTGL